MPGEEVDVVDAEDRVVGSAPLARCLEAGLVHRAVAVIVTRPDGRVVLQRRSKRDPWHPGKWTLSCTGHVRKGEPYLAAAKRELSEELGVEARLVGRAKVLLPPIRSRGLVEREWVRLFTARSGRRLSIDAGELEAVGEFRPGELEGMLAGRRLTQDAKALLRLFLRERREWG